MILEDYSATRSNPGHNNLTTILVFMTDDRRSQVVIVESRDSKVTSELSKAKLRKVSSQQENLDDGKDISMQMKCQAMKYQAIKWLAYKLLTCCQRDSTICKVPTYFLSCIANHHD